MESVNEVLGLLEGQAECESAMKQPGGARVFEEQELHAVERKLSTFQEDVNADGVESCATAM